MPIGIHYCVPRTPRSSIINCDDSRRVVNHPFVSPLETISAVSWGNKPHQVGLLHDPAIPLLPLPAPSILEAFVGAGTDEPDRRSFIL